MNFHTNKQTVNNAYFMSNKNYYIPHTIVLLLNLAYDSFGQHSQSRDWACR